MVGTSVLRYGREVGMSEGRRDGLKEGLRDEGVQVGVLVLFITGALVMGLGLIELMRIVVG